MNVVSDNEKELDVPKIEKVEKVVEKVEVVVVEKEMEEEEEEEDISIIDGNIIPSIVKKIELFEEFVSQQEKLIKENKSVFEKEIKVHSNISFEDSTVVYRVKDRKDGVNRIGKLEKRFSMLGRKKSRDVVCYKDKYVHFVEEKCHTLSDFCHHVKKSEGEQKTQLINALNDQIRCLKEVLRFSMSINGKLHELTGGEKNVSTVKTDLNANECYDIIVHLDGLTKVTKGWRIEDLFHIEKDVRGKSTVPENALKAHTENTPIIGVFGYPCVGKTHLLSNISGAPLPESHHFATQGISVRYVDMNGVPVELMDTSGIGESINLEKEWVRKIESKERDDLFFFETVLHTSDFLFIVVKQNNLEQQIMIEKAAKMVSSQRPNVTLVVIHNIYHVLDEISFKKVVENEVKKSGTKLLRIEGVYAFPRGIQETGTVEYFLEEKEFKEGSRGVKIAHFFIGNDLSPSGDNNKFVYGHLRNMITSMICGLNFASNGKHPFLFKLLNRGLKVVLPRFVKNLNREKPLILENKKFMLRTLSGKEGDELEIQNDHSVDLDHLKKDEGKVYEFFVKVCSGIKGVPKEGEEKSLLNKFVVLCEVPGMSEKNFRILKYKKLRGIQEDIWSQKKIQKKFDTDINSGKLFGLSHIHSDMKSIVLYFRRGGSDISTGSMLNNRNGEFVSQIPIPKDFQIMSLHKENSRFVKNGEMNIIFDPFFEEEDEYDD